MRRLLGVSSRFSAARCPQTRPATGVIWKDVTLDGSGKLDVSSPAVGAPTSAEVEHLAQLHRDVDAAGKPEVGKSWMTLSCFAVLTTVEALSTGVADPMKQLSNERDIFAGILHAMGVSTPGSGLPDSKAFRRA